MNRADEEAWSASLDLTHRHAEQSLYTEDPYDIALQFMGDSLDVFTIIEFAGSMYNL